MSNHYKSNAGNKCFGQSPHVYCGPRHQGETQECDPGMLIDLQHPFNLLQHNINIVNYLHLVIRACLPSDTSSCC
jgi:hypothetical protein